jgi:hypothetical protein
VFLWRGAAGRSALSNTSWTMGLGVVLGCEVTESDKPGKDVSEADVQTVLPRWVPWRSMRCKRIQLLDLMGPGL